VLSLVAPWLESPVSLCVTAPSFPGLAIRIDTLTLAGAPGGGAAAAGEPLEPAPAVVSAVSGAGGGAVVGVAGVVTTGVAIVTVGVVTVGVVATGVGAGVVTVVTVAAG
jgi:hypothetical protein